MSKQEDYGMSYEEYMASRQKPEDAPLEDKETREVSEQFKRGEAEQTDVPNEEAAAMADSEEITESSGVFNKISSSPPIAVIKKGAQAIARVMGIPAWLVTAAFAILTGSTIGVLGSKNPVKSNTIRDCYIDPTPMVVNEEYVWATYQEKDDYARAMFRALNTDAISVPFMDDTTLATGDGLLYFPNDRSYEQYYPYGENMNGEAETKMVEASHGFQVEAIMGMISNADAEGAVIADGFEYNFGVGPMKDSSKEDITLSSTHHYNWDVYVKRMFERYEQDGVPIIKSAYKYRPRVLAEDGVNEDGSTKYKWIIAGDEEGLSLSGELGADTNWLVYDTITASAGSNNTIEHFYPGMGLWGWTGALAYELQEFCDTFTDVWEMNGDGHNDAMYTMNGQLAFLLYSEDWFKYLDSEGMPSQVNTLKKFKVTVPDKSAAAKLGLSSDATIYQICQAMYEKAIKDEEPYIGYISKETQQGNSNSLKKVRKDFNDFVSENTHQEIVTAKEWAALSVIHYDLRTWVYHPEDKVDDFKFGDVSHMFQNTGSWEAKEYEYSKYVLDAKDIENLADDMLTYLINNRYESVTYENSDLWLSVGNWSYKDKEELHDVHNIDINRQYPYANFGTSYKLPDIVVGTNGYQRRQSSFTPIPYDHNAFDRKTDFNNWLSIINDKDCDKLWDDYEKDIWNWDVHVECVARDRFGRILTKTSTYKNTLELDSKKSQSVSKSFNGWDYSATESDHTYSDVDKKLTKLEKGDPIRIESRPWTEDEFNEWYAAYYEAYKSTWDANIDEWCNKVFEWYKPYCHDCDSGDCKKHEGDDNDPDTVCSNEEHHEPTGTDDEGNPAHGEENGCDGCINGTLCDDCTGDCANSSEKHTLDCDPTCDCDGPSGDDCDCEYTGTKNSHNFHAKYVAGFIVNDIADEAGLKAAEKIAEKINKELRFDVLADWGVDLNEGVKNDTADCAPDADSDSDHDGTSAGGLACETLAYEWSLYFEGITPGSEELLNGHMWKASHYYEIYTGTQKEWYCNGGYDVDGKPEKKHRGTGIYTYEYMPHVADDNMWYYGTESTGRSALQYYVGDDGYWWHITNLEAFTSERTSSKAVYRDKTLDDWDVNWKYPERWIWTSNYNMAEAITGLFDRKADHHDNTGLNTMKQEMAQYHCGVKLDMSTVQSTALAICWPRRYTELATMTSDARNADGIYVMRLCTEVYVRLKDIIMPEENVDFVEPGVSKQSLYSSCDRGAMTIVRSSGADPFFPHAFPEDQLAYCEQSDLWYDVLSDKVFFEEGDERKTIQTIADLDKVRPGDILITTDPDHIVVFVGGQDTLTKYPDMDIEYYHNSDDKEKKMPYYIWFTGKLSGGRYAVVHSSAATHEEVAEHGTDYARGLMLQTDCEFLMQGNYRVFRPRNADMNSIGAKWTANSKWITLRNYPKGELRNAAYEDLLRRKAEAWS